MRRLLLLVTVIACLLPVAPVAAAPAAPPRPEGTPPAGFTDSLVVGGIYQPTAVAAMPDGRTLVLQKEGQVRVILGGAMLPDPAMTLSVCTQSERGLLGVALDPDFGVNGFVYIYYTRPSAGAPGGCVNRVSRFLMGPNTNTIFWTSEVVLLDNIGSPAGNHNGGDLAVGNDGYLYVAVGDGGNDPRGDSGSGGANNAAQDLSLLNGKILRVDRSTGAAAPGNPLSGPGTANCRVRGNTPSTPTTWCREIFAWGLRNPWRFAFDPNTGATRFYINDVGQGSREEVNLGVLGANYGWPAREGVCAQGQQTPCPPPDSGLGYTQPITDYSHDENRPLDFGGEYITGGAFVPNGAWSEAYDGGYIFSDGNPGRMFFKPAVGSTNYALPFVTNVGGVTDIEFAMDSAGWALYYIAGNGELRKIAYNTSPAPLPADASAFVPVTPSERAFDSRNLGGATGMLRAGTSRLINVVDTVGSHRSALVNITLVRPTSEAYATVWQPRTTRPFSSNINGNGLHVTANSSIVPIDANGDILLFVSATTHVIVDVMGFFDDTASNVSTFGRFQTVTPVRAADTRQAANGTTNQYSVSQDGSAEVVNVPIEGQWGVPANTSAVAVIVTGLAGAIGTGGFVVVLPDGGAVPESSNVNVNGVGDVRANLVVVPVGANGTIDLRLSGTADVLVDVVGSFTDSSAPSSTAGMYTSINPTRLVDSRFGDGFNRLPGGTSGSANSALVPDNAVALSQNIVITRPNGRGFITAYPTGLAQVPTVSNGNVIAANQTRSAMAFTSIGTGGSVSYFVSVTSDVIVDVTGYFNPAPA
ncbi:MAG: PQQ-dependent sugar dehydrogenase [Actinomycetota bacterium]|nr:PQQ-dependent sugar dehydrogenase [Actinomycetota bacterium]